jgi:hypothetical protein
MIDIDECLAGTPLNHCEYEFVKTSINSIYWEVGGEGEGGMELAPNRFTLLYFSGA